MNIEALLFDMGNVLIRISFQRMLKAFGRDNMTEIEAARLVDDWRFHDLFERGRLTEKEFFQQLRNALGLSWSDDQLRGGWNAIFEGEVSGMNELLARLSSKIPLYLLSNTNPVHFDYCDAHFPCLKHFTKHFLSYEIDARKPEKAIYDAITKETGKPAVSILFFDDVLKNVEAARQMGFAAEVVLQSASAVEGHIRRYAPHAL